MPAGQQVLVKFAMWGAALSFPQQLTGAVQELKAAVDAEDVRAPFPFFTDVARYTSSFKKLSWKQFARKSSNEVSFKNVPVR